MEYAKYISSCKIVPTLDQNETDFTKALRTIQPYLVEKNITNLVVVCETSGRIDHIMANINTLFKRKDILGDTEIMMLSSNSISWLLCTGTHTIHIPRWIVNEKLWCGLIPFWRTKVTTKGLKWDLGIHFVFSYLRFQKVNR